jgi:hypothetical protein
MVDFAKLPGITNKQALIANAIAYRKHPRNALNIDGVVPSMPFCEKAPCNPELNMSSMHSFQLSILACSASPINTPIVPFRACE